MARLSTEAIQLKLAALKEQERKLLADVKKAELKVAQEIGKLIIANPALLSSTGLAEVAKVYPSIKKTESKPAPTATSTPTPASTSQAGGN